MNRLVMLKEVASESGFGKVERGSKKHDKVLRFLAILEILISKGLKRQLTVLKVSRSGMIARASKQLLDSMILVLVEAVAVSQEKALTNSSGKHLKQNIEILMKEWSKEANSGLKRKDVLRAVRIQYGVGGTHRTAENGEFTLSVKSGDEFEEQCRAVEASKKPQIDERGGVYESSSERNAALKGLSTQRCSVFDFVDNLA